MITPLKYIKQTSSQNTIVSRYAKRENGTPFKNKHREMEHLSTQVEQRQIEWRRAKVLELSSQGDSQREIADTIHVGIGTINRDMAYLRSEARKNQVSHPRQTA
jgi:Trp operon repressor